MFFLKNKTELKKLEYINKLNAELLAKLYNTIKPGIQTKLLEEIVIKFCEKHSVLPTFKNYEGFPHYLCVSVNDEVIHGFPNDRVVKENDLVSVDCGLNKDGFHSDSAFTKLVGKYRKNSKNYILLLATKAALARGIEKAVVGNRIYDISKVIYDTAIEYGFDVVKDFTGHGTGFYLHEDPNIPNYVMRGVNWLLHPGMVIAIEPMFVAGSDNVYFDKNGWVVKTADGAMAAHFEHTVAITNDGPIILSKI